MVTLVNSKYVFLLVFVNFIALTLQAQKPLSGFQVKIKSGLSEYMTSLNTNYRSSDRYPGRTYYWYDKLEADPANTFLMCEVERSINRIQIGIGFGYARNGFSYTDGYLPVGLLNDSLPNELNTRLDFGLLINSLKVGYQLGNRLSFTPYIGLYNTRLDGIRFESEVWNSQENVISTEQGTTKGDALLVWDNAIAFEIESLFHVSRRISIGVSVFRSQTVIPASEFLIAKGIGVRKFFITRYQRQGGTFVLSLNL